MVSISTASGINESIKDRTEIVVKRSRKSNWTDAAVECHNRVDYNTPEPAVIKSKLPFRRFLCRAEQLLTIKLFLMQNSTACSVSTLFFKE